MTTPAEDVVARQLTAYQARDLDVFMACWAADAKIFAWPATPIAQGASEIREHHRVRFEDRSLEAVLLSRTSVGTLVVDHERVTRRYPEGVGTAEVIGIYEVVDGVIVSAWFRQGEVLPAARAPGPGPR